jgi:hypothetical protein
LKSKIKLASQETKDDQYYVLEMNTLKTSYEEIETDYYSSKSNSNQTNNDKRPIQLITKAIKHDSGKV